MKKILIASMLLLCVQSMFSAAKKSDILEPLDFDLAAQKTDYITYTSDPRFELMGILCRIAGYNEFKGYYSNNNNYLESVDNFFGKYSNDKIIKKIQAYKKKGISPAAWISLAYHIKNDFSGTTVDFSKLPETLNYEWTKAKIKGKELEEFVKMFHDFAKESGFQRFYGVNRGEFLYFVNAFSSDLEKRQIGEWTKGFFETDEIKAVTVNISRLCAGLGGFYDYASDENGDRVGFISVEPGIYEFNLFSLYFDLYTQLYATENWNIVKDHYSAYLKSFLKRGDSQNANEIDKREIIDADLATNIGLYVAYAYYEDKADQLEDSEDEDKEFYAGTVENLYSFFEKAYGKDFLDAVELLQLYKNNRETYPTFESFYSKLNEYVNNLPLY